MVPEKQKKEHKYVPPAWMDEKVIKTLSPEKQQYWANRILGKKGQGEPPKPKYTEDHGGATTYSDNEGNMVVKNRAARRRRPITPPYYTKSTHSLKKLRGQIK